MAHPNEQRFRQGYEAFSKGDLEAVGELLADDVQWHVAGNNPLAGTKNGKEETFALFGELVQRTGGTFQLDVHDVFANDQHGVALTVSRAQREGRSFEGRGVHVVHFDDQGRVKESWQHAEDQQAVDEFWS